MVDDMGVTALLALFCGIVGLAVGSFLNVVVWRVPRGESVVAPAERLPAVRPRDPRAGTTSRWSRGSLLRGPVPGLRQPDLGALPAGRGSAPRCCSPSRPGSTGPDWGCPRCCTWPRSRSPSHSSTWTRTGCPTPSCCPSYPVAAALLIAGELEPGRRADWCALLRAAVGGAALFAVYFALVVACPGGMGFGDVKLAGRPGALPRLVRLGRARRRGVRGVPAAAGSSRSRCSSLGGPGASHGIPFGPWMLLGAAIGIAVGERLWAAYLGTF